MGKVRSLASSRSSSDIRIILSFYILCRRCFAQATDQHCLPECCLCCPLAEPVLTSVGHSRPQERIGFMVSARYTDLVYFVRVTIFEGNNGAGVHASVIGNHPVMATISGTLLFGHQSRRACRVALRCGGILPFSTWCAILRRLRVDLGPIVGRLVVQVRRRRRYHSSR